MKSLKTVGMDGMSLKNITFFLIWENIIHFDKKYEQMCYAYVYTHTK